MIDFITTETHYLPPSQREHYKSNVVENLIRYNTADGTEEYMQ